MWFTLFIVTVSIIVLVNLKLTSDKYDLKERSFRDFPNLRSYVRTSKPDQYLDLASMAMAKAVHGCVETMPEGEDTYTEGLLHLYCTTK